jgi:hypothetical protein
MANEISTTFKLAVTSGNLVDDMTAVEQTHNQSNARLHKTVQTIGTSEETIVIPADITSPKHFYARNVGATNNVKIGMNTGNYLFELEPGKECGGPLVAGITLYAIALSGSSDLLIKVLDA